MNEKNKVLGEVHFMLRILMRKISPIITGDEVKDYLALKHYEFLEVTKWDTFPKPRKDTGNIYSSEWGFLSISNWKNSVNLDIVKSK